MPPFPYYRINSFYLCRWVSQPGLGLIRSDCSLLLWKVCFLVIRILMAIFYIYITRTLGAAGPLALESGSPVFFWLFFTHPPSTPPQIYLVLLQILQKTNYHKLLPQTTINIYYQTNFCSNLTIFQFYHTFFHNPLP